LHRRVLATALTLVLAGCGGSAASPSPSGPAASPLAAGTYTSSAFQPAVTFTVPDGWELATDSPTYLQLRPAGSDAAGVYLFRDPAAASQDPTCPTTAQPGIGTTSSDLVTWFRGLKGLVAGDPAMVTVGGLRGTSIDLAIADGWTTSCPFANGLPTVPLITGDGGALRWVMAGNERLRLYLLDLPAGGTVVVDVDAFDGSLIESLVANATPIIKTLKFAGG
jgi:hypothetical protein